MTQMQLNLTLHSLINERLDQLIPEKEGPHSLLYDAARYSLLLPGKRLRPLLLLKVLEDYGTPIEKGLDVAAALEMIHTYSLIHDDLPCMDDDDLRRGKPTVHVKWDEATAVLVGDALQSLAFEILAAKKAADTDAIRVNLIGSLARASGAGGMVLGQMQDIAAETAKTPLTLDQIVDLQANKTGALIKSIKAGVSYEQ